MQNKFIRSIVFANFLFITFKAFSNIITFALFVLNSEFLIKQIEFCHQLIFSNSWSCFARIDYRDWIITVELFVLRITKPQPNSLIQLLHTSVSPKIKYLMGSFLLSNKPALLSVYYQCQKNNLHCLYVIEAKELLSNLIKFS